MKTEFTCLIVDDERPALKLLTAYISKIPNLKLIQACENAIETISALQRHQVDLLFLDIQMPHLTGIELLKVLQNKPQVVFTTAYREYAVEGFALNVTDYLVKPFSFERFVQAVNKATEKISLKQVPLPAVEPLIPKEQKVEDHFFVRTNYKMEKVVFKDITHIESMREYVAIHTPEKRYIVNQTMNKMEEALPKNQFMRVHRSHIVGLNHIAGVNGNMILIGNLKITIGASYRRAFFEQLRML